MINHLALIVAITSSWLLIIYMAPIATRLGLVDLPSKRKHHSKPVPLIGGLCIAVSFFLSVMLLEFSLGEFRILFFSIIVITIVGLLDDYKELPPYAKFLSQIFIGIIIVLASNIEITNIGDIFNNGTPQGLGGLGPIFLIISVVGVINAFNMIDGHDGLAGLLSIQSLAFLIVVAALERNYASLNILLLLSVGICVFLIFNLTLFVNEKRKVFLGDTGSMFIGLIIVYFLILLVEETDNSLSAPLAPWLIAVPLMDMFSVIIERIILRKWVFSADRNHLHHVLLEKGLSKSQVLVVVVGLQGILLAWAFISYFADLADWIVFWSMFPIFFGYVYAKHSLRRSNLAVSHQEDGLP